MSDDAPESEDGERIIVHVSPAPDGLPPLPPGAEPIPQDHLDAYTAAIEGAMRVLLVELVAQIDRYWDVLPLARSIQDQRDGLMQALGVTRDLVRARVECDFEQILAWMLPTIDRGFEDLVRRLHRPGPPRTDDEYEAAKLTNVVEEAAVLHGWSDERIARTTRATVRFIRRRTRPALKRLHLARNPTIILVYPYDDSILDKINVDQAAIERLQRRGR